MFNPLSIVEKKLRPALWGFFICMVILLGLVGAQEGCRYEIEHRWADEKQDREQELTDLIVQRFDQRVHDQFALAGTIAADGRLIHLLMSGNPADMASAFDRLEQYQNDEISIDLADSQGTILAWSGRSVTRNYGKLFQQVGRDSLVVAPQVGIHRYLSVGLAVRPSRYRVVVSRPLEINYPISNRFVTQSSFSDELSDDAGAAVRLVFEEPPRDSTMEGMFLIPLKALGGIPVAYAIVPSPTVQSEVQNSSHFFDRWEGVVLALGVALLGWILFVKSRSVKSPALRAVVGGLIIWAVRLSWREVEFPGALVGGLLFDPTLYASPFLFHFASSLGELVLSCAALFLTSALIFWETVGSSVARAATGENVSSLRKIAWVALAFVLAFGLQWIVRAFGATMRSLVFDSTLLFQNPASLLPDVPVFVMHFNILLLTLSLLCITAAVLLVMARCMAPFLQPKGSEPPFQPDGWARFRLPLVLLALLIAAGILFLGVDRVPQVPLYFPLILFGISLFFLFRLGPELRQGDLWRRHLLRNLLILGCSVFVLSAVILDAKLHEKERQRVQAFAVELLRPVDSWLSFVVSDGLRSAVAQASGQLEGTEVDSATVANLAFTLWAQTLMSREGYNSAVFVYDRLGKEVSRFSVGLTSYEQVEVLSKVFDAEEEVLQVVERKVPSGTIKYYGEWGSVLDSKGRLVGWVAVVLSASQMSLFRAETPEPLRTGPREEFEQGFRQVSISEYQQGVLVSTTDPTLFRGSHLAATIVGELAASKDRFVWTEQNLDGKSFNILYAKDAANNDRIIALGIESLDIRWHLFNLVKALMIYATFFCLIALVYFVRFFARERSFKLGFREKLVSSFALLSVVPLLLMAYYNRELAIERLNENITRRLSQDLTLLDQRVINSVLEESDFTSGINNDYCEVAAADLGVDFSVYAGSMLQASSRPELYRAAILDRRLTGVAYVNTVILGRTFFSDLESIGEVSYIVGYRPIVFHGRTVGVLSVPALYRQQEIDQELAQRNAFMLGAYAFVVLIIIVVGIFLANRLSRPLRDLSEAATSIGKGNLDVQLSVRSADEVGELVRSFNEMTKELKVSRENVARAERELAWKEMAKQVAHEIKNPLTPMKLSIQHLLQAYKDGVKDYGQILQRVSATVIEQIEVLSRIASEFSHFARMPERRFERVDVKQLLQETVALFSDVRGIEFHTKLSDTPAILVADRDELRRVFINLIRNSVQAMEKGGKISVELAVMDQVCGITISDTGSGIPDTLQPKVFQPNFSTKTDGMGLGLAIAVKVVEDLNGTIHLRSAVGKGTTIEMRIPLRLG
jgi:two-component system nitrogen regulation sensor histidine kinase NtrY